MLGAGEDQLGGGGVHSRCLSKRPVGRGELSEAAACGVGTAGLDAGRGGHVGRVGPGPAGLLSGGPTCPSPLACEHQRLGTLPLRCHMG